MIRLSDLNLQRVDTWPPSLQWVAVLLTCLLITSIAYCLDLKNQYDDWQNQYKKELALQAHYENQWPSASHLEPYTNQIQVLHEQFTTLLTQLTEKNQIPKLVEDISRSGLAYGLSFEFIKLQPEKKMGCYTQLPIHLSVTGHYHQLIGFLSTLSHLPSIITISEFSIQTTHLHTDPLHMNLIANTFQYTEAKPPCT